MFLFIKMSALRCFLCLLIFKAVFLNSEIVHLNIPPAVWAREMMSYIDDTVDPCDDFYEFACGNWGKFNPIPEGDVENNEFVKLHKLLMNQTSELLEEPIHAYDSEAEKKAKEFYSSCIDIETRRKRGLGPLFQFIKSAGGWPLLDETWNEEDFDWLDVISKFISEYGISILLGATVEDNVWNVSQNQIYISGAPLFLQNRDYYYDSSKLNAYKEYMLDIFELLGVEDDVAQEASDEILKFERDIAIRAPELNVWSDNEAIRVPTTMGDLQLNHPAIDWDKFIQKSLGIQAASSFPVIIVEDDYISNLLQVVSTANEKVIANYIMWMITSHLIKCNDDRFDLAEQKFMKALIGSYKIEENRDYCIFRTNYYFGFVLGAMYIRKHFNPEIKNDIQDLVKPIKETLKARSKNINWMDSKSIERLREKIERMHLEVGYPEYIMKEKNLRTEYKEIEVDPEKYFENALSVIKYIKRNRDKRLITEEDKAAYFNPVMTDVFYKRGHNTITIPAAILQYPIYDFDSAKFSKFGRIGAKVTSEMIRGFEDMEQVFDCNGNMTESAEENFNRQLSCVLSQYESGEQVAELLGLREAYYSYKKWLKRQVNDVVELETSPELDLTSTQLFFLSYAQLKCHTYRPEALGIEMNSDNHSPLKYRVNRLLSHLDEFSKEFQCSVNSNMNSQPKCELW